jgi:succinate--hydroxymethylglutarate CoA-transferase
MKHTENAPERWSKLDFESSFFSCTNRNKRSLTVDLKTPDGLAIAKKLAAKADVLVENVPRDAICCRKIVADAPCCIQLITGKLQKIGLGYDVVSKINPRLIYCSITGRLKNASP